MKIIAPFNPETGVLQQHAGRAPDSPQEAANGITVWKEVDSVFNAILKYAGHCRSTYGTVTFFWEDVITHVVYPMSLDDMNRALKGASFQEVCGALVDGRWKIHKGRTGWAIKPVIK